MRRRAAHKFSTRPHDQLFRIAAVLGISFSLVAGARAGDILRSGAVTGGGGGSAQRPPNANSSAQAAASANARDTLARTTQAVQAVRAMQDAARAAAASGPNRLTVTPNRPLPNVPNGLKIGGLQVAPGVPKNLFKPVTGEDVKLWQGANLPTESTAGGRTTVNIVQTKGQAVLNWKTFNVGRDTTVNFDQSGGGARQSDWIAFNKINDPSGRPSQILGSITGQGQVYLLNQNGILFGGSSQINLHTLVASTLPLNDNLITRGLLNNPDAQFLFSATPLAAGSEGTPAFNPTISDPTFLVTSGANTYTLAQQVAVNGGNVPLKAPEFTFTAADHSQVKLVAGTDYTLAVDGSRKATATFTAAGLLKIGSAAVSASYTPVVVKSGDVIVQRGASLSSPVTADGNGGRVMLVGANVKNEGTISTPAGQTILAAGLQVGVNAHKSADPSLRGLDIFVGAVTSDGAALPSVGTVTNLGLIDVPLGNATLTGKTIEQFSVIDSTTSTALNGRIDLLAAYGATSNPDFNEAGKPGSGLAPFLFHRAGLVDIGPGSVLRILPDFEGTDRAVGTELALSSQINVQGQAIHFRTNSQLLAPNADVTVNAGNWVLDSTGTSFKNISGQIYLDAGASINVAGSVDVSAPISENILTLQLRGAELANSPLQRAGLLRGPTITVDARQSGIYNGMTWVGTPLGDVSGYVALIQRSVGELTTAGGTVNLNAGESVIMQPGSRIDVSGGWVNFEGGLVQTTRVLSGGVLYDLAQATPDRVYDGIYTGTSTFTHLKYGLTETFTQPLALLGAHYEQGYLQGAKAGAISISAPSMALDGTLRGNVVEGPRQSNSTTLALATGGSLTLSFQAQKNDLSTKPPYAAYSPTPPDIVFDALESQPAAGAFVLKADGSAEDLSEERKKRVVLSSQRLAEGGFSNLTIENGDGNITVPVGTEITTPLRGSVTFRAANLEIAGKIVAPGGALNFTTFNASPFTMAELKADSSNPNRVAPPVDPTRGIFTLGAHAELNTAGLITDYRPGPFPETELPPLVDGGSITINAFTAHLTEGSVIDVSGGVSISATGKRTYGAGGSIVINAGRDPSLAFLLGGKLVLDSTLKGFSGGKGGALSIQAPLIQIGGVLPTLIPGRKPDDSYYVIRKTKVQRDELLYLTPEFFTQGGFSSYTLNGIGKAATGSGADQFLPAISIAPGTVIQPVAKSWLAVPGAGAEPLHLEAFLKPFGLRTPVSLSFNAPGTKDDFKGLPLLRGDFTMGAGAVIATEPKASVTVTGDTIAMLGSIYAPAGAITLSAANLFPTTSPNGQTLPLPTIDLGPQSVLSTAGRVLLTPDDPYGRRIGAVLAGGTISVSGNLVAEAGALLDVSGASGWLDLPPSSLIQNIPIGDAESSYRQVPLNSGLTGPLYSIHTVPTRVDSDGGSITLRGGQELFTDATLRGFAGGPSAKGGSLSISSGRFIPTTAALQATPLDINLIVTQSGQTILVGFYPPGETAIGHQVPGTNAALGLGHFAADAFLSGGFDALKLSAEGSGGKGAVDFSGPVSITARRSLSVGDGGSIFADAAVYLDAPYVALGTAFQAPLLSTQSTNLSFAGPFYLQPTFGAGSLTVHAGLLDIGNLSLQNIGRATFIAEDIRGNGTLDVAGSITLQAGQIFPTTASQFTIAAYDPNITVAASSTASKTVTLASAVLPPGFGFGSPLLGTKVAAINGTSVTLEANANATITNQTPVALATVVFAPGKGSVTIASNGTRELPYSAGGTLNIYGSNITQGGTLRAPLGTINIGWDGTGTTPIDYLTGAGILAGQTVATTRHLALTNGSVTSVSAVDPATGTALIIPYGFSANGTSWIDPTGKDITAGGVPGKAVNLSALSLSDQAGSLIDVRGGGDLYAYRWITGNGGTSDLLGTAAAPWSSSASYSAGQLVSYQGSTWSARQASQGATPSVSQNWTLVPQSFAIIPSYDTAYAPYAPFNNAADPLNLAASDPGYVSTGLAVGDRITLGASSGLSAGTYTLLPARYALLPGAVLITPQTGIPIGTFQLPEGASIVAGYRFNALNPAQLPPAQATRFEVASSEVLRARAQYDNFLANSFLKDSALALGLTIPRLPLDSGRVVFSGLNALQIEGDVLGRSLAGGHGAQIDISSLADILITGANGHGAAGEVVLNAGKLSSFGAESLLIGGIRTTASDGTTITVKTSNVTVANAGTPLTGPEIILVAKTGLTLAPGAQIIQSGSTLTDADEADPLRIGNAAVAGSGNGLLLRVSDVQAPVIRSGITTQAAQAALANPPVMTIGAGATIFGGALTLDSTYGTTLSPTARIIGSDIALNSGQIILQFGKVNGVPQIAGLTLSGPALQGLQTAQSLSLLSYSTIDLYGAGSFSTQGALALHAAEIRGFNNAGGNVTFSAPQIILDNSAGGTGLGSSNVLSGGLVFDAGTLLLGAGQVSLDQFATVHFKTTGGVLASATGGLTAQGALKITAPLITGSQAVNYAITAAGAVDLLAPAGLARPTVTGGLGATLSLTGASLTANSDIALPSGSLTLRATTGDLVIGNLNATHLDAAGTAQTFNDLIRFTNGGRINLVADAGAVTLGAHSEVSVAAQPDGGSAGSVSISAAQGSFTLDGKLNGRPGAGGKAGEFSLDVQSLADVTAMDGTLNEAAFNGARTIRVRLGDVTIDGLATAQFYHLSADTGSITVTGNGFIDASGATGGDIRLAAFGSVTLESGARLSAAAEDFSSAGKGGAISLEAGSQNNGVVSTTGFVDVQSGSTIDLTVASLNGATPAETAANTAAAALLGNFTGTLHLRAPQNAAGTDLLVNPVNGTILGASNILVEGYRLFDLTNTNGVITNTGTLNPAGGLMVQANNIQGSINANGQGFLGTAGTTSANYTAMMNRLLGADPQGLSSVFVLAPGAEIIHRTGTITLGASNSTTTSDWNLATFRYGAKSSAGVLTIRAAGNLVFNNTLSDGFTPTLASSNAAWMYRAQLTAQNPLLPVNLQSWSYRLSAGADLAAADFQRVLPLSTLGATAGSLQLGKLITTNNGNAVVTGGLTAQTSTALAQRYQVIRTGSGDITISAGRDVQLLNQFATIYTAGTRTADPTLGGNFQTPPSINIGPQDQLGSVQQNPTYPAQYSLGGGNVTVAAQRNIEHLTITGGVLVADSEKQMPTNWLYRRGYVDPVTGEFGVSRDGDIASTTWWVDFSNFFEGVGALGGGNVTLQAGNDVSNVDAVAPTNARMTYQTPAGDRLAANQSIVELGGGDVTVRAGQNIDAGIYYVERGQGTLDAGNSIIANSTRTASLGALTIPATVNSSSAQWLPTTLFLGKGGFAVSAANDLLLGPVVNPFLLPAGVNNSFSRRSYFSTYAPTSEVTVTSLGGSITLRETATRPGTTTGTSILLNWLDSVHRLSANPQSVSLFQPWLRLDETNVEPFATVLTLLPGTLRATAFSGDINLVGRLNLSPSPTGTIELAAAGALNGLQINGITTQSATGSTPFNTWSSSMINLSDANPAAIPGINTPFGLLVDVDDHSPVTASNLLSFIDQLFGETGATTGSAAVLQTQQILHGNTLLHADDPEPIRLYAGSRDISGLTLYSSKAAQIVAGGNISDIAFYIQNTKDTDVSVISSGQDIVAYNANSPLRTAAQAPGNLLDLGEVPLSGDLQISGPGTLEVLAGRNLDLGTGANNADGTGVGLTSIGNARNPNLPFGGADIVAAAGIGPASGLAASTLDFDAFITKILTGEDGERYLKELAETNPTLPTGLTRSAFKELDPEVRAKLALEIFYLVLRDAGRDHNLADGTTSGNYEAGFAAIAALFGDGKTKGDITTRSRDIRTKSGGNISLLAPGGGLTLATSTIGTPLAPPGIITESGGNVSIFTNGSVDIGISRIFTLRGGNEIIWSSEGDIAAGTSSKTVQSAPPTRVLIDPQSASVQTDLAGLATGGGIGVLATVEGVAPGNVDLIAPAGTVDAGDAGIRASGNLNIAAVQVLNADNIQVAGTSAGTPVAPAVAAPNLAGLAAASSANAAGASAAQEVAKQARPGNDTEEAPSIITVDLISYTGGEDEGDFQQN